jgi:hypothetical protein
MVQAKLLAGSTSEFGGETLAGKQPARGGFVALGPGKKAAAEKKKAPAPRRWQPPAGQKVPGK